MLALDLAEERGPPSLQRLQCRLGGRELLHVGVHETRVLFGRGLPYLLRHAAVLLMGISVLLRRPERRRHVCRDVS